MLHAEPGGCVLRLSGAHAPVAALALGQVLAWGTLYYGIAFLAPAVRDDTGWGLAVIHGGFSAGLMVAALLAGPVGRLLDRAGGRAVMSAGSLLAALAFVLLASSHHPVVFLAGWLAAGAAMAMTLYEAAFPTLRQCAGVDFRRAVGAVTLLGGFASTVFWPLSQALVAGFGWRATAMIFAALHLGVGLPLHRTLPAARSGAGPAAQGPRPRADRRVVGPLAFAFACAMLATSAVAAHAGILLDARGPSAGLALAALALIGPMQVTARLLEWRLAPPVRVAGRLAFLGLATGLALLAAGAPGGWPLLTFAILYGAANGVLTVVRGGAPAEWLPGAGYGATLGALSGPALAARAVAPLAAAAALTAWGAEVTLWLLVLAALAGLGAFCLAAARAEGGAR